ncbi:MAG TPA: preprotein translocase subunit SecY [Patescibacteria group bacterium]|nr:preprotein translocase subunit SecY [Patescibacteria group bacterium]
MGVFSRAWKTPEIRQSLLFALLVLVVFRVLAHIPIPGVNTEALTRFFQSNQFFGLLNIFSGGTLENFSIVAMGVAPYITASIIFQLLAMIIPSFEEMQKEEQGRQRLNQWTRLLTVPLGALQAFGLLALLRQQAPTVLEGMEWQQTALTVVTLIAGTVFIMWLGELLSERNIGNGISLMIFAGIVAGLPSFLRQAFATFDSSQFLTMIVFAIVLIVTVFGVVVMHEAQRNVPVQYARQTRGTRFGGQVATHLPLRVNMAGVIPIIFAISIILLPSMLAQFFLDARSIWLREAATTVLKLTSDQWIYGIAYALLVFLFTYFYTTVVFHPEQVAQNLQLQGGFVPGIRPGRPTAEYLTFVVNRVTLAGAVFLAVIAVLPLLVQQWSGNNNLAIGGTSLLIVVSVVIESVKQIESQLTMREYEF